MAIRTELELFVENRPGALAQICSLLASEAVNLLALAASEHGRSIHLLVDNPVHAAGVLRDREVRVDTRDVLYTTIPNEPGGLARLTRAIAEAGIDIDHFYASALERGAAAAVVIGVKDVQRASAVLGL